LHRLTLRKKRKDNVLPAIALVGYTHAGKSTLLNALTNANQFTSENIFTTLDPLSKNLRLANGENVIISDTVGFLHNLPHHLIEAFKATLEEVVEADLLIHVLDASHAHLREFDKAVFEVLKKLKVDTKPVITVLNKIDLLDDPTWLDKLKEGFPNSVGICAKLSQNLDLLLEKIQAYFSSRMTKLQILIPHSRMDLVDLFYREGKIEEIKYRPKGIKIKLTLPKILSHKLLQNGEIRKIS
jgi:GTP-binding protein HflX